MGLSNSRSCLCAKQQTDEVADMPLSPHGADAARPVVEQTAPPQIKYKKASVVPTQAVLGPGMLRKSQSSHVLRADSLTLDPLSSPGSGVGTPVSSWSSTSCTDLKSYQSQKAIRLPFADNKETKLTLQFSNKCFLPVRFLVCVAAGELCRESLLQKQEPQTPASEQVAAGPQAVHTPSPEDNIEWLQGPPIEMQVAELLLVPSKRKTLRISTRLSSVTLFISSTLGWETTSFVLHPQRDISVAVRTNDNLSGHLLSVACGEGDEPCWKRVLKSSRHCGESCSGQAPCSTGCCFRRWEALRQQTASGAPLPGQACSGLLPVKVDEKIAGHSQLSCTL